MAAKVVEFYGVGPDGTQNYDGALHTCGINGGLQRRGYTRIDSRVVYQYYAHNLPRPDETQYPLYQGPTNPVAGQPYPMSVGEFDARMNEATGFQLPPEERTELQQSNYDNLLAVTRYPAADAFGLIRGDALQNASLTWLLGGRNPYSNLGVVYRGSDDDAALNARVARYDANPWAVSWLHVDSEPTGRLWWAPGRYLPTVMLHVIGDPQIVVEHESVFQEKMERAGTADYLFQGYVTANAHCGVNNNETAAGVREVLAWVDSGKKPTQDTLIASCEEYRLVYGGTCRVNPAYQPGAWEERYEPRPLFTWPYQCQRPGCFVREVSWWENATRELNALRGFRIPALWPPDLL